MPGANVKRRTRSCALCHRRKIKCDSQSHPCKQCQRVGQPCVGLDPVSHLDRPRSLVQWLESEVNALDTSIKALEATSPRNLENKTAAPGRYGLETTRCNQNSACDPGPTINPVLQDITFPWLGFHQNFQLADFILLSEAAIPLTDERPRVNNNPTSTRHILSPALANTSPNPLQSIPRRVADFLLENYVTRSMASYPIFHEPRLRAYHVSVFSMPGDGTYGEGSPYETFIISLVMAISLSTAARAKQARANKVAFKLFHHACRHVREVLTNDIFGLQALLVLAEYAIMNPLAANVYYLCGYIMQACIELGLHREEPLDRGVDYLARDLRRRIFWSAWEMDASCSSSFCRPVHLLPKDITTDFPSEMEDNAITSDGISHHARRTKFICGRIRGFRLIEAEIISVLFHNEPFPSQFRGIRAWMVDVEERIETWGEEIQSSAASNQDATLATQWSEMSLFASIARPLMIITLFRPCPKIPDPSVSSLVKAFKAATEVAEGYYQQANMEFGSPKYTFQPCHHVFSAAGVFLHALRQVRSTIASLYTIREVESFMETFSRFFSVTAERWPAALRCLREYERLLEPLKQEYLAYAASRLLAGDKFHSPEESGSRNLDLPEDSVYYVNSFIESIANTPSGGVFTFDETVPLDWNSEFQLTMPEINIEGFH
ncbi:hypothetical protein PV04_05408 [Phialophora macrospora]|uniref:Zn(2)-C6 fungal-type domain-containing protein n=1 Tax=Phialophora macrospora TaxID=1851006 RepID=A0A0D2FSN8_9EURO|nr:hypothetical protein PV04_05408 [Phialophora macrospora]